MRCGSDRAVEAGTQIRGGESIYLLCLGVQAVHTGTVPTYGPRAAAVVPGWWLLGGLQNYGSISIDSA
jgi:hypothetical protein